MSDRVTVGLIGYGFGGAVFHAPLIVAESRLRLKSVATTRTELLARNLPDVAAASIDAIFADPEIQLVVITTPNTEHFPLAKRALESGRHVVVDKPFTITLAEADELVALAERKGLLLSVFHNRRWDGDFQTVRQLVKEHAVGRLAYFESHFDRFRPAIKVGWREETGPGTGLFYDLAPHLIDQALQLFGLPKSVFVDTAHLRQHAIADDYFHLVLEYDGMRAVLHASNLVYCPGPRFSLLGDRGTYYKFELDSQEERLKEGIHPGMPAWGTDSADKEGTLYVSDGTWRKVPTIPGAYEKYYAGIAASILTGAKPPVTAREGHDVMMVLEAGLRSAREKKSIALSR